jgi:uncharacterized membrane protein
VQFPAEADSGVISVRVNPATFTVVSGDNVTVPAVLLNRVWEDTYVEVTIPDLPSGWGVVPVPAVWLSAGGQRQAMLTLRVPPLPQSRIGQYQLKVRATVRDHPDRATEAEFMVTVDVFKMQGRVGVQMESAAFAVTPGQSVAALLSLLNQGLTEDDFVLSVDGIPETWISTPSPVTRVPPGERRELPLTIAPPRLPESVAGVHPFALRVASHGDPDQAVKMDCTLAIAPFTRFASQLRPFQVAAGGTAAITVQNRGNTDAEFTIALSSERNVVRFSPTETVELSAAAAETVRTEFRIRPRRRPLFGGEAKYPYRAQVQSHGAVAQALEGEVITWGLIPGWLVASVLILGLFLGFAYLYLTH